MHETIQKKALDIEYPRQHETITSAGYTFRIAALPGARKVEVSVDGGCWQPCRRDGDAFWYDWYLFGTGDHDVVARMELPDGEFLTTDHRAFCVELNGERVQDARRAPSPRRERHAPEAPELKRHMAAKLLIAAPNRPEIVAELADILAREAADVQSVLIETRGEIALCRLMVEKDNGLRRLLEDEGFQVVEEKVFRLELNAESDELQRLTGMLAERGVSIRYLYGTAHGRTNKIVLCVDRPADALKIVRELGRELATA